MVNFWLLFSSKFIGELLALDLSGMSTKMSLLNTLHDDTLETIHGGLDCGAMPDPFVTRDGKEVRNCYTRRKHDVHLISKDFKELTKAYPDDFQVLGAWHFSGAANGYGLELGTRWENGGLMGAPWFIQPPGVERFTAANDATKVPHVAGQAPRMISP
jgi:hypothetical protein